MGLYTAVIKICGNSQFERRKLRADAELRKRRQLDFLVIKAVIDGFQRIRWSRNEGVSRRGRSSEFESVRRGIATALA
jgi:hypothetical protein